MLSSFPTPLYSSLYAQSMNTGVDLKAFLDSPFGKQFLEESRRIASYQWMKLLLDDAAILKYIKETSQPTMDDTEATETKRNRATETPKTNKQEPSLLNQIKAAIEADLKSFDVFVQHLFKYTDQALHNSRNDLNTLIAANDTLFNNDQTINTVALEQQQQQSQTLSDIIQQLLSNTINTKNHLITYCDNVKRAGHDKLIPELLWKNFAVNLTGLDKRITRINDQQKDLNALVQTLNNLKPFSIKPSLGQTFGKLSKKNTQDNMIINNISIPKYLMKQ